MSQDTIESLRARGKELERPDFREMREMLRAMQAGELTVSRGIEILDMWHAGNWNDDMLPPVRQDLIEEDSMPVEIIESLRARVAELEAENTENSDAAGYHAQWSREFKSQVDYLKQQLTAKDQRIAELEALCAENNGIIQRMGIGIKDKDRLIAQLVRDAEMYGPNKLAIEKQAWVMADSVREIRELRDQLAAQALTIKTMREALNIWINIAANCSIESGCCCCGESMKNHSHPMSCGHSPVDMADSIAYEAIAETDKALALPDNSTEILQEWLDKQLGDPVAFIRVSDEEDRFDGRDYEGHSLTNFVDPCGFQVFRKPEIKK